jgi:hypothetical protein
MAKTGPRQPARTVQASLNNPGSAEFLDTGVEIMEGKYKVTLVLRLLERMAFDPHKPSRTELL